MAFGFPASYEIEVDLLGDRKAAREAVVYAFDFLEWSYETQGPDVFLAKMPMSMSSWGEKLFVSLADGRVAIRSVSVYPLQLFDWGKNKQNVEQFLAHFSPKELRSSITPSQDPLYIDNSGITPVDRMLRDETSEDR
jgi:hypothetical protein